MEAKSSILKLNPFELEAVLKWVDSFELSRCRRKLNRDFSDGVLLAEILKVEFPNLVELHNYSGCFAVQGKIENWDILNRKVLKKLQIHLQPEEIEKIVKSDSECIEGVLFRIMNQVEVVKSREEEKLSVNPLSPSIMTIKVFKQIGDQVKEVPQKMIEYSIHEELLEKFKTQHQKIKHMEETIDELIAALKSKTDIINDLQKRLEEKQMKFFKIGSIKESFSNLFWLRGELNKLKAINWD